MIANSAESLLATNATYIFAYLGTGIGDPNWMDCHGYDFVAMQPNGVVIYRRKPWWKRLFYAVSGLSEGDRDASIHL